MKSNISKETIIKVCDECQSMAQAAVNLHIHFNTFKRLALLYGCYNPNQGLKGGNKISPAKIDLKDILEGKHPYFQTFKLKNRLLKEGLIVNKCAICGIQKWNHKLIQLELDHIDGIRFNHRLSNLRLLCPNCHSQTETFRAKNKAKR